MFCTNCGAPNKDDAKFCVKCGESFGDFQRETKPSPGRLLKNEFSQQGAGFFKALFDFSFTSFVTSKIIKFLYGLSILLAAILALILIVAGFSAHPAAGIIALLIVAPLLFLISVIYSRVLLEIIIVIFRISENTSEVVKNTRKES